MIVYEDLTFPEVDALPRDLRWVLPVGEPAPGELERHFPGYGRLPALPYGHQLSPAWPRLVDSLLACLAEDGFTEVTLASARELPGPWPRRPVAATELAPRPASLALVPIGHTEQHGFHLPLSTDTVIVEALARRAEAALEDCWRLPVFPYGVSMHRREFPGTLTVDPRAFEDFWTDVCGALGCEAVFLVNGHGGNHSFLVNVVKFAGERFPSQFTATTFLHTASGEALQKLLAERSSRMMGHACELETAYLLALRPELVKLERVVDEPDFTTTPDYGMDWVEDGALIANPPWSDDTRTGSYGSPSVATAEKGRVWLEAAGLEMARLAAQVREQGRLRRARRAAGWRQGAWRERLPAQDGGHLGGQGGRVERLAEDAAHP